MTAFAAPVDYQQLFHSLPENLLLMAPDATIIDNTDNHVAASLKPRAEVLGKTLFEAFPSVDQNEGDVIFQSHEHVRRFHEPHTMPLIRYDLAVPAERGGGFEEMYWQATHYPILDGAGNLQFILQRTQNVTEQHRAALRAAQVQADLDESQDRTRFILENLPVFIWTATPAGDRDYFNSRWLNFTGKEQATQTGRQWATSVHEEDRARVLAAWEQSVSSGEPYQVEYRLRRHDGQYRWILVRAVPRRNADGDINMWVGAGSDIHEQRQMVQELLSANEQQNSLSEQAYQMYQRAESQRETYQTLFIQAPAMTAIARGPEHRFEFVNPAYQQLFPHRELVGHTVAEVLPEIKDQGIIDLLDNVYRTGETFHGNEMKMQLERDASGTLKDSYFNFVYQQFRESGQPAGVMVFAFEVTGLVRARQALEKVRDASAQALDDAATA
ncbi:PAS domain-containing protein [Hymenobacter sp. DH14]|uniref:histidine kinase n=1 Tax=Hymenobacter cyanobacteriorum TaxID=2926463 RepID=A0A9X1VCZ8_9BACT|nr:PAS domain-containing protein [Hymenobacter cyanobacteriorum]MCI1186328.1 PAS domain-containing protein [Hymenobacter cyanobacteriorum]